MKPALLLCGYGILAPSKPLHSSLLIGAVMVVSGMLIMDLRKT